MEGNAPMESCFGTIKTELVHQACYPTRTPPGMTCLPTSKDITIVSGFIPPSGGEQRDSECERVVLRMLTVFPRIGRRDEDAIKVMYIAAGHRSSRMSKHCGDRGVRES